MGLVLNKVQRAQWLILLVTNSRKDNATVIGLEPSGGVKSTRKILMKSVIEFNSEQREMFNSLAAEITQER